MQLALTPEEAAFRDELRTIYTTKIPEELRERVRQGSAEVNRDDIVTSHKILHEHGLAVPNWPVEWGGKDWTPTQHQIWADEMQLACVPEPLNFNTKMVGPVIAEFGSEEIKQRFLPPTASLDIWWCQGFSEPEAGSDLASLRTTAVRDGDSYVVNGQKTWTTLGQYADWIFCLVRTDPQAPKRQAGISFLLFDMKTPGITLRPIKTIDGGHEVNEVFFSDVRVPANQLVGEENQGWTYAKFLLGNERTGIAGVGRTKVRLAEVKKHAAADRGARRSAVRGPAGRGRKRAAGTGTHAVAGGDGLRGRAAQPGVVGAQAARQPVAAGGHRTARRGGRAGRAARRRRRHRVAGLGATQCAALPQLPQDVDLRRQQRSAAQHHRVHHSGIVRQPWTFS